MNNKTLGGLGLGLGLALSLGACGGGSDDGASTDGCNGAKCDTPGGSQNEQCEARQAEVLVSSQRGFTPDAIRWACADVEGVNTVNRDDRGQEYCEYYAIFQPPLQAEGEREAFDLGRPKSRNPGDVTENGVCVEGEDRGNCRATISEDQLFWLEDNPTSVVGTCVFTSWHADVPGPLPVCAEKGCEEDGQIFGFPFDEEFFRMKISFNSNGAASDLVQQCVDKAAAGTAPLPEDWSATSEQDPLVEPFFRGCMSVQDIFGTGWRRSDPSVCAVANRLVECGCGVPGVPVDQLGVAVVPPQPDPQGNINLRGFRLGTWDDGKGLPPGCRYGNIGDDSQTVVLCDLTATDVKDNLNDPKEQCRALYGNQVVVHVPLPKDAIECSPPDTPAAAGCGQMPWNIGDENAGAGGGESGGGESGGGESGGGESGGGESGGTGGGGPTHDCCEEQETPGCSDATIQNCVCNDFGDSFCCTTAWDNICVGEVSSANCGECG